MSYKVSWTAGGRAEETRRFDDWEPAAEFYQGLVADRRTGAASLVEVTEAEVRCFEREATAAHREPAPAVPAGDRMMSPPAPPAGRGRTWLTEMEDAP